MKTIRIKLMGFWPKFKYEDNFIVNKLRKHFNVEFSDTPDYVISSCFTQEYLNYPNSIRIFYTGENICPDFNVFDYAISYEKLNYGDRHLWFSDYLIPEEYGPDFNLMLNKHKNIDQIKDTKTDFCSFVVSKGDGYVMPEREVFFNLLSKYKRVNSGGRFLNNIGEPNGIANKLQFQRKHKFAIAFENSSHLGYTTEKIIQAFAAQTIPIYFGNPDISKYFNTKSFINCHDFTTFDDVIEQIKRIDNDESLFLQMLSEPALLNQTSLNDENDKLDVFLQSIFNQSKEKSFRRDRFGYGKMHCDYLLEANLAMTNKVNNHQYRKFFPKYIYQFLKKCIKKLFKKEFRSE